MLARITGTLVELTGNQALIEPEGLPGLGYEVLVPGYLADRLLGRSGGEPAVGSTITLHTMQYLEGQNQGVSFIPRILGFASAQERTFFDVLTSVKGLGNKRGLRAMAVEPGVIARAIAERDARALQRLPEIGPKLADLIVHELKGKVDMYVGGAGAMAAVVETKPTVKKRVVAGAAATAKNDSAGSSAENGEVQARPAAATPPIRSTVDALIALGENPVDAERMVARAVDRARASGETPTNMEQLLALAYASR